MRQINITKSSFANSSFVRVACVLVLSLPSGPTFSQPAFTVPTMLSLQSEISATSAYDCTQVGIDEIAPALLTKEERIALLDKNLDRSMNSFSHCVSVAQQEMTRGGLGGEKGGTGESTSQDNNGSNVNNSQSTEGLINESQEITIDNQKNSSKENDIKGTTPTARDLIPPKNNDKVICKLLYQEIMKTTDPGMLEGLKQQYANYKCGQ